MRLLGRDLRAASSAAAQRLGTSYLADCVFLVAIVFVTAAPYAAHLGFYSDDWNNLETFRTCPSQSMWGFFGCLKENYRVVESFQSAALYRCFGRNPVGYHVVNSIVFACLILLIYTVLRELSQPRVVSLTVPLIYSLLPHYSTDRFWIANFEANLCMVLYLAGVFSLSRARPPRGWRPLWAAFSAIALVLSSLAYEVAIPLFVLVPFFIWGRMKPKEQKHVLLATILLSMGAVAFKLLTQTRYRFQGRFLSHPAMVVRHFIAQLLDFNYGYYGFGLPRVAWHAAAIYPREAGLGSGALLGILIFSYLFHVVRRPSTEWPSQRTWATMVIVGGCIFVLGYSPFIADVTLDMTTTGVYNRVAIAAALGTAMSLAAIIGLVAGFIPFSGWRAGLFGTCISVLCVSGLLILNVVASYWMEGYRTQQDIIAKVVKEFPELSDNTTLILDGVCPYLGPGIVFEGNWDTEGMLRTLYRNDTLRGDVVTPKLEVRADGLHTFLYDLESQYSYSGSLIIYNVQKNTKARLLDFQTARLYFSGWSSRCPPGREGYGSPIF
jgi:hypothetical protein